MLGVLLKLLIFIAVDLLTVSEVQSAIIMMGNKQKCY